MTRWGDLRFTSKSEIVAFSFGWISVGANSAIEAALRCHRAGAQVSISYRRPQLEARSVKYWLAGTGRSACTVGSNNRRASPQ